jgi:hypothetical protein
MAKKVYKSILIVLALLVFAGCKVKQGLNVDLSAWTKITEISILPPVDLRPEKKIKVNFEKQIRGVAAANLKKKSYANLLCDNNGSVGQLIDEDIKAGAPEWIKRLGPEGARYVMVLCLVDVTTKMTFGSTGNAEVAGYLYDKESGTTIWHGKGLGQSGQGGLMGMAMKSMMDEDAISFAMGSLLASIPKKPMPAK